MNSFDVSITYMTGGRVVRLPSWLARSLETSGYNRVKGSITDEGILLVPYRGHAVHKPNAVVDLPDWGSK